MKPIMLKIKGFNSFIDEQVIDFQKLMDKGIFGIFGPTGSGKSSIIDAMTFALYGSVARYENLERRAFINANTDSTLVEFKFSLTTDKTVYYEVSREIKKSKAGRLTHNARLIKTVDDIVEVISDKTNSVADKIIEIIGLNYQDFIRSVVLPQGKFSEFLLLKSKEKREMLERIFGLENYGSYLNFAINERRKEQYKVVADITSKLEVFGDISQENIDELKKNLYEKKKFYEVNKQKLEKESNIFDRYKNYMSLKKEFDEYKQKENEFIQKKSDIDKKILLVENGKKAEKVFAFLEEYKKSLDDFNSSDKDLQKYSVEFEKAEKLFDKTKNDLEKFNAEKNLEYPLIIKKETELNQALETKKHTDELISERNKLRQKFKSTEKNFKDLTSKIESDKNAKIDINKKIKENEKRQEEIFISQEYRLNVENGVSIEKSFDDFNARLLAENENKKNLEKNVSDGKKKIETLNFQLNAINDNVDKLQKRLGEINQKFDFDVSYIIQIQNELENDKRNFQDKKEKYKSYADFDVKYKNVSKDIIQLDEKYKFIIEDINNKQRQLDKLEEKVKIFQNKDLIFEIARKLSDGAPCPVCGSTHHPKLAEKTRDELISNTNKELDDLKADIDKLVIDKNSLSEKIAVLVSEKNRYTEEISKVSDDIRNLDVEKEEKIISDRVSVFDKTKIEFDEVQNEKKKIDKELNSYNSNLNKLNIEIAETKSGLNKDSESLVKSNDVVNELLSNIDNLSAKLTEFKQKNNIQSFKAEYDKIISFENEKIKLENEQKSLRIELDEKQKNIEKFQTEANDLDKELKSIKVSGKEKTDVINRNLGLISEITGDKDINDFIDEISSKKKYFDETEIDIKEKFQNAEKNKNDILEKKVHFEKQKEATQKIKVKNEERLNLSISQNGFDSVDEVEKYHISNDEIKGLENEIVEYNDRIKEVLANIKNISEKIAKENISCTDDDVIKVETKIQNLNATIEETISEIGKIENKISETTENFAKVKDLRDSLKIQTHKLDLISDLANTMKGNRFVEYIARKQLYYVTKDASERLGKMTNGRYAIELDGDEIETANFVIRDDFSGGNRRTPQSLSGGEMFLTSLSLALALSSKIQLKNNAPLETFFLDEGFGTLDQSMLDVVMDSLERLSSEKMNVGIITHVEEIKNRIQSKLIVEPSDGIYGTKVRIE